MSFSCAQMHDQLVANAVFTKSIATLAFNFFKVTTTDFTLKPYYKRTRNHTHADGCCCLPPTKLYVPHHCACAKFS